MARRLGPFVKYGELRNNKPFSTFGILVLDSDNEEGHIVIRVELAGDCGPDLKGKTFRFEPSENDHDRRVVTSGMLKGFQQSQIGATGTMTASGWVKVLPCPTEEYIQRCRLGEAPPTEWGRHLYLEWYGQNGRVVVELAGAVVEMCTRQPDSSIEDDEGDWVPLPHPPREEKPDAPAGLEFTVVEMDGETAQIERWSPVESDPLSDNPIECAVDTEARNLEAAARTDEDILYDAKLIDHCIDHEDGVPVIEFFKNLDALPKPDDLDDYQAEIELKKVLAQLALIGIALDICEHFTPKDCYRLLVDKILPETEVYEPMIGSAWVQHTCTYEYCAECDAEAEREYQNYKNNMPEFDPNEEPPF